MIEVEMVDDIRKTETKFLGTLTFRQLICVVLAASYSIPIAILVPLSIELKFIIGVFLALPVAICGWIKLNNEPFEIVVIRYIYKHFLTPSKRKVKCINPYKESLKVVRKEAEKERVKKMTGKQRAAYEKRQKKGKTVTYSKKKSAKMYK